MENTEVVEGEDVINLDDDGLIWLEYVWFIDLIVVDAKEFLDHMEHEGRYGYIFQLKPKTI